MAAEDRNYITSKTFLTDEQIIALYEERSQTAVAETARQYGRLILNIAGNILGSEEDARECENDTYMALWNSIPPQHPVSFVSYLCRIAKNIALRRFRDSHREKRCAGMVALDELENVLPSASLEDEVQARELGKAIDRFLTDCEKGDRIMFVCRYWYGDAVSEIARELGVTRNAVSIRLHRTRAELKKYLKKEGLLDE